jgi:hypothetical protein
VPKKVSSSKKPIIRKAAVRPVPLRNTMHVTSKVEPPYGKPPAAFTGSLAEWACMWALDKLKIAYEYQVAYFGGRLQLGGAVVDFYLTDVNIVIRIQGMYWHYYSDTTKMYSDQIQKMALEGRGIIVIDIDEDKILKSPIYYVKEAYEGRDHSRVNGV